MDIYDQGFSIAWQEKEEKGKKKWRGFLSVSDRRPEISSILHINWLADENPIGSIF